MAACNLVFGQSNRFKTVLSALPFRYAQEVLVLLDIGLSSFGFGFLVIEDFLLAIGDVLWISSGSWSL